LQIQTLALEGFNNTSIAKSLTKLGIKTSESAVRRFFARNPEIERPRSARIAGNAPFTSEKPGAKITGDTAVITSSSTEFLTPDELFVKHGLNPSDWTYDTTLNQWDGPAGDGRTITLSQLKIHARRRVSIELIAPARIVGWNAPKRASIVVSEPYLVIVNGDAHHPYIEPGLDSALNVFLEENAPRFGIDTGDGGNQSALSRWGANPGFDEMLQTCINEEYRCWRRRIVASPNTQWKRLPGNHDEYIIRAQLEKLKQIFNIKKAWSADEPEPEHPVLDLANLLRLDELDIEMIRPDNGGHYHGAQIKIAPGLMIRHGSKSGKLGGAVKAGERLTCSTMQGHDHKQVLAYLTRYDDEARAGDAALCSVGALCQRDLGYQEDADVQQGFATVMVWPDGRFHIELARYDDGELVWRDKRYKP